MGKYPRRDVRKTHKSIFEHATVKGKISKGSETEKVKTRTLIIIGLTKGGQKRNEGARTSGKGVVWFGNYKKEARRKKAYALGNVTAKGNTKKIARKSK